MFIEQMKSLGRYVTTKHVPAQKTVAQFHDFLTHHFTPYEDALDISIKWQSPIFLRDTEIVPEDCRNNPSLARHFWASESVAFVTSNDETTPGRHLSFALINAPTTSLVRFQLTSLDNAFEPYDYYFHGNSEAAHFLRTRDFKDEFRKTVVSVFALSFLPVEDVSTLITDNHPSFRQPSPSGKDPTP